MASFYCPPSLDLCQSVQVSTVHLHLICVREFKFLLSTVTCSVSESSSFYCPPSLDLCQRVQVSTVHIHLLCVMCVGEFKFLLSTFTCSVDVRRRVQVLLLTFSCSVLESSVQLHIFQLITHIIDCNMPSPALIQITTSLYGMPE